MNTFLKSRHFTLGLVILAIILFNLAAGCDFHKADSATASSQATKPIAINTLKDLQTLLREIAQAEPAEAQTRVDEAWQSLVSSGRVPLILGNQVVFLYKGEAEKVNWRGSFNGWSAPGIAGFRVGKTDLWVGNIEFPEASRAEYKIVLNDKDWLVDPANPNTAFSGLTGANNVVILPGFKVTDESRKRSDVTAGTLSEPLSIDSSSLGYTVNYWVYTPAGYENLDQLRVIYVLDGNDFIDERMGALPDILDNMIASGRVEPVLAVFVDAREPGNPQKNRREDEFIAYPVEHARFIADELVPVIDQTYHTDRRPEARVIMGVSFGGLSAFYIAASRSDVFHKLAAFSPSLWVLNSPQYLSDPRQVEGSQKMLPALNGETTACGGTTGFECPRLPVKVFLTAGLPSWDVGDLSGLVKDLKEQKYPVEFHQVNEGHTWDNWRGLSDEMLIYFFTND